MIDLSITWEQMNQETIRVALTCTIIDLSISQIFKTDNYLSLSHV